MKTRDYIVIFTLFLILMTIGGCSGCNNWSVYNKGYSVGYEDCKAGKMKKWYPIIYDIPNILLKTAPKDLEKPKRIRIFKLQNGNYEVKIEEENLD